MYNPTCLVSAKKDNLRMHAIRNESGDMIGWVFLHESVNIDDINAEINWKFRVIVETEPQLTIINGVAQ